MQKALFSNIRFTLGMCATILAGLYLIVTSWLIGKDDFFLILNLDLGPVADQFFRFWTNMGDGVVWIAVAILFYIYHRNKFPLLIASVVISTLIVQVTKNFIYPNNPRPTAAIADIHSIHTVPGVELNTNNSFPSGHTATAFTLFLLACLLIPKNRVLPLGFLAAFLVGYSRIYLAQHFPVDVGAGMLVASVTIILSIQVQRIADRRAFRSGL